MGGLGGWSVGRSVGRSVGVCGACPERIRNENDPTKSILWSVYVLWLFACISMRQLVINFHGQCVRVLVYT